MTEGAKRTFDLGQDINHYTTYDKLWEEFKQKYPKYRKRNNQELKAIMDGFFSHCGKVLINTPHGIVLNRIGYLSLTVFAGKKKMVNIRHIGLIQNFKADGNVYRCYYYPIKNHNTIFRGWMFVIKKSLKEKIKENINKGMKYYNHLFFINKNTQYVR